MEEKTLYYLWIDSIKGGSTMKGHEGCIPIWNYYLDDPARNPDSGASGRSFDTFRFEAPEDHGIYRLVERMTLGEMFRTAKLDQVSNPQKPATLLTMEVIDILELGRADQGFGFRLRNRKFIVGAGYTTFSGIGPYSRWAIR